MLGKLLKMTQKQCHSAVIQVLKKHKVPYIETDKYIATTQHTNAPLICTHLDTVGPPVPYVVAHGPIWQAPVKSACLGADDRAGLYIALQMIIEGTVTKFDYGFFHDEEKGAIGSSAYKGNHSCFIGLDRASKHGVQNIATYGNDDRELIDLFVALGYEEQLGSMSDCSVLAEKHNKACVNVSVGYDKEHTSLEFLDIDLLKETLVIMLKVVIPDRDYPAKQVSRWSGRHTWPADDKAQPVLCDLCYAHALLYELDGQMFCSECLEYVNDKETISYAFQY
jgi:hypothetical protein